jgi:hypothetical protein
VSTAACTAPSPQAKGSPFGAFPYAGDRLPDAKPKSGLLTGGFTTVRSR